MDLPEMQVSDAVRDAAEQMVYGYYMQHYQRDKLTPKGATLYYDAREALRQAAFDANPQYCAFAAKPSGRPGNHLKYLRFDDAQRQEAQTAFDRVLQTVVAEASDKIKGDKTPEDFVFPGNDSYSYYGTGYPPRGVPAELTEVGAGWQELVKKRGDVESVNATPKTPARFPSAG